MQVCFDIKLFEEDWWRKGCVSKVLMYFLNMVIRTGKNEVKISRRQLSEEVGERECSVRDSIDILLKYKIINPVCAQARKTGSYLFSTSYINIVDSEYPVSTQMTKRNGNVSPSSHPVSTQIEHTTTSCKSDNYNKDGDGVSPSSHPVSTQIEEKEKTKEKSPIPPIKKIKKKEGVLTDSSQRLPDGKVVLNKRAREIFEKVYLEIYGTKYYWTAKDAGQMTILLNAIKFSRANRKVPLPNDTDSVIEALDKFLISINKTWINDNYSVSMISSHYNEIISELKNKNKNGKAQYGADGDAYTRKASILSNIAQYDEKWKRKNGDGSENR